MDWSGLLRQEHSLLGYVDMVLIPAGAREIHIKEMASSTNFLALRSEDPDRYFLNGNWTIQWNGNYQVAGAIFTYTRDGDQENLTSPGPLQEPVWIQVLLSVLGGHEWSLVPRWLLRKVVP